jgi:DHA1 family bicyclomycin/chloramphenicol resistance-like MFS transporter
MKLKHEGLSFTLFLGAVCAIPPLSIDMGLPAIPQIEAHFPNAAGHGPLTLSLFLVGFAISPLLCGPLADRFGRRRTLLTGLVGLMVTASAAAAAPSFDILLGFRLLQGFAAGACAIIPFAIVRDVFTGATARHRLSQVTAVLGIAPMVAPILGGWVMALADWRAIYVLQAAAGVILLIVTAFGLTETLPAERRRSISPRQLAGSYRAVLSERSFRSFALIYACGFACMFAFISGSPSVLMSALGLSPHVFSLLFALTSCGVLVGSLLSGRLSKRHVASSTLLTAGLGLMTICSIAALALAATGNIHTYTLIPLVAAVIFGFGLSGPTANHEALQQLPHVAGAASGVMRCQQMIMGAIASGLIALFEPYGHAALVMTAIMTATVLAAGGLFLLQRRGALVAKPA